MGNSNLVIIYKFIMAHTIPLGNDRMNLERTHQYLGTVLPIPESVIKLVKNIAKKQRCPDGLVFTSRDGTQTILDIANPVSDTLYNDDYAYQPFGTYYVDTALTEVISSSSRSSVHAGTAYDC